MSEHDDDEQLYQIVRFYEDDDWEVILTGLTLAEARAHCNDPETSSRTATSPEALAHTAERDQQWFDGFERGD